jgi:tetraacyldisaccharide-1-P 4'-kinase
MNVSRLRRFALWPLALLYGVAVRIRTGLYAKGWLKQRRLDATVISVGNLTTGGTGKTPMVIWLAEKFLAEGKRVGILSRGYRGTGRTSDEVEIIKQRLRGRALFGVGNNRYLEGCRLEKQGIDIFILDDGFQHRQLARDYDIVLIDSTRPLRQQALLPAGSLREPVSAVKRADMVIFTRTNHAPGAAWAMQHLPQFPVFPAKTKLIGFRRVGGEKEAVLSAAQAVGPFFAFCGIGNPEGFFDDLAEWRVPIVGHMSFRDHHRYTAIDVSKIERFAARVTAKAFVTTEKDEQNLGDLRFTHPTYVAVITLDVPDEDEVLHRIKSKLWPDRGVAA